ncbi:MAG: N-acetylmuramoyl-L-alanine amidase, partial [Gallionella sp.]
IMIKQLLFTVTLTLLVTLSFANGLPKEDYPVTNPYKGVFANNYATYSATIPVGMLEAVAFSQTHFTHITHASNVSESCINIPNAYGVMGLIADGKSYFRNNLSLIAALSGISENEIINSPAKNIEAYAAAYNSLAEQNNVTANSPIKSHIDILIALSELPLTTDIQNDFAINAHLYNILNFINNYANYTDVFVAKPNTINLHDVFGENYSILSSSKVTIDHEKIYNENNGTTYRSSNIAQTNTIYSADYAAALWSAAGSCNYSSRSGTAITALAIHTVQGSYAGCISWFTNCSASASAHYVIRSSDGQVTQMVLESAKAWHVASENPYAVGIEHEGYIAQPS